MASAVTPITEDAVMRSTDQDDLSDFVTEFINGCGIEPPFYLVSISTDGSVSGQIRSIHIPGEIPDLQSLHLHVMDHDLITLTECTLG
jgi:hypothetical protein